MGVGHLPNPAVPVFHTLTVPFIHLYLSATASTLASLRTHCPPHLFPSASSVESGNSVRLVSGSRKPRAPPIRARLLYTSLGRVQW